MRFRIEERYDASPEAVVAAFTDPEMYATYTGLTKIAPPEVLDSTRDGDRVTLRLRMTFIAPLSAAARAVVDPAKLGWVQEEVYDLTSGRATVVFHPDNYADRFTCTGGYEFIEVGDDGGAGCIRRQQGDLRVRVLLVGGEVERGIIRGLEDHAAEERIVVGRWLRDHPGPDADS